MASDPSPAAPPPAGSGAAGAGSDAKDRDYYEAWTSLTRERIRPYYWWVLPFLLLLLVCCCCACLVASPLTTREVPKEFGLAAKAAEARAQEDHEEGGIGIFTVVDEDDLQAQVDLQRRSR